jgi:glycosyltransferase involved in cell wall biosynthesis
LLKALLLYGSDHRQHIIIRRKIKTFLECGIDVSIVDQSSGSDMQSPADYQYVLVRRSEAGALSKIVWSAIQRLRFRRLSDLFWSWVLWFRLASNATRVAWTAMRIGGDCYIAEDLQSAWAALLAARLRRRPIIYNAHELQSEQGFGDEMRVQKGVLRALERRVVPRVEQLVVPNHSRGVFFAERYGVRSKPVVILNCPPFQPVPGRGRLRQVLDLPDSVRIVLYHGALTPHRALDVLLKSAALFAPDIVLVLVGEQGDYFREVLSPLREKEHLHDRVLFSPFVPPDEIGPYVASADLGIVIYENINLNNYLCAPTKLYEFIMMGVPVAACNFPELVEFLEQYPIGPTFDPRDPGSIASAINAFFSEDASARPEVQIAVERARQRFTWEQESLKWLDLLNSLTH